MGAKPLSRSTTPIASPKGQSTAQPPVSNEPSTKSEEPNSRSSDARSSSSSDSTQESESVFLSMSPTQSPPSIQVMERPEDCDPSSISDSTLGCSFVSNDSLFSIGLTDSYGHDHEAYLLVADASGELIKPGDLISLGEHSGPMSGEINVDCLKTETPSKSDVPMSTLDEPQKVVRWKTQVELHTDEVGSSQVHHWQPTPVPNYKPSELGNQGTAKPKKRFCWSSCNCSSCNQSKCSCSLPKCCSTPNWSCGLKWSCWKGCWTSMSCSNCKPKKPLSSQSKEATATKKTDVKLPGVKKRVPV